MPSVKDAYEAENPLSWKKEGLEEALGGGGWRFIPTHPQHLRAMEVDN